MNNNTPKTETQFSVFIPSRPGQLGRLVQHMAANKINIVAMSMMDSTEHRVLRLVPEDAAKARQALAELDIPHTETSVLTATLPNRPGALADVIERLDQEHIQVHYAYCTTGARNGKTLGIFKVSNPNKAQQVLTSRKVRRKTIASNIRRPAVRRR